mmetsp:Transcript_25962/g.65887  ORF Transcript_25962/g.65887 Transcript_25962/m.65887 type:complete len:224 (-) Transcript_25962:468-1139(-)
MAGRVTAGRGRGAPRALLPLSLRGRQCGRDDCLRRLRRRERFTGRHVGSRVRMPAVGLRGCGWPNRSACEAPLARAGVSRGSARALGALVARGRLLGGARLASAAWRHGRAGHVRRRVGFAGGARGCGRRCLGKAAAVGRGSRASSPLRHASGLVACRRRRPGRVLAHAGSPRCTLPPLAHMVAPHGRGHRGRAHRRMRGPAAVRHGGTGLWRRRCAVRLLSG